MNVEFIFSEIENDLKTFCIDKVADNKKEKNLIIVPEQNTLNTDLELIEKSKNKAFMFSNILSFKRLAFYVLNETNVNTRDNLTPLGQNLVIKKVLHEVQDELKYYKNSVKKPSFAEKITETINQMSRYNFKDEDLNKVIDIYEEREMSETFKNKLFDLRLIHKTFKAKVENNYLTSEGLLEILKKSIKDSNYIKGLNIYITSFYSFSVQENLVIYELAKYCNSVTIAIPMDSESTIDSIRGSSIDVDDFFYEPKNATKKLIKLFDNIENCNINFKSINSKSKNENIEHIIKNYNKNKVETKENSDNIKFYNCKNKYSEIDFIARYISNKVLNEKYRYKDIVLVCPDFESYEYILKNTFNKYNIPIFYDRKDLLYKNRVIEVLRSAMDSVVKNMKYESVFRFLKCGIGNFCDSEINQLENYIIEYGIRGYMWRFDKWEFGDNQNNLYDLDLINDLKNEIVSKLEILENKNLKISEHCKNLYSFIENLELYEYIEYKLKDENNSTNEIREYEQVWEKLVLLLENMYEFLGDEVVSFEEFFSIFEAGVQSEEFGQIPTYNDQVTVANINRSKIGSSKLLIFMDATDKNYPKYAEQNTIFDTEEMENILNTGYRFFDDSLERFYAQNLALFLYIARVEDELVFTKSKTTIKGEVLNPAKAVVKVQNMFEKDFLNIDNDLTGFNSEIKSNIYKYKDNEKVFKWYKNNNGRIEQNLFESIENEEILKNGLSKEIVDKIYGKELLASVSKLEKYVQCPYSYFLRYNLKAKPNKVYEASSLDYGQIFHKIFEIFFEHIKIDKKNWKDIDEEYINYFVDDNINFCVENMNKSIFTRDSRYKIFLDRIAEISKVSIKAIVFHINSGDFDSFYTEASFKENLSSMLNIDVLGKNIKISGEIDRVDLLKKVIVDEEGNSNIKYYAKIIDYKSSNKTFSLNSFYNGLQLQLIVYLDTVMKNYNKMINDLEINELEEAGVFYFTAQNPIIDKDKLVLQPEEEVLKKFKMNGLYTKDENIMFSIDNSLKTDYTDDKGKKKPKKSNIINANIKVNGELDSRSSGESEYDIENYRKYVNKKITEIGENIFSGNISVKPIKEKGFTYCNYCDYKGICKIDLVEYSERYREIDVFSNEEIRKKIKEDLEKNEKN